MSPDEIQHRTVHGNRDLHSLLATSVTGERPVEPRILSCSIHVMLRNHAISGETLPGTKVADREVAEAPNVSRAPERDTLMRLVAQDLVVAGLSAPFFARFSEIVGDVWFRVQR